jgi:hypothetical protein
MSLLNTASLIVTPNGYKEGTLYSVIPTTGAGDMSVVRATTATRVNSAGLVELVPYNLLTWSEDFSNADWTKSNVTISANALTAPNGTLTADKLVEDSSNGLHYINIPASTTPSGTNTLSVYAKANGRDWVWLYLFDSVAGSLFAYFNVANGTLGTIQSGLTANIESVGNGWYRCSITRTQSNLGNGGYGLTNANNVSSYTGDGTSGSYLWGAQLVEGTLPKDYLRAETRLNIPRLDYSNGTCPSLLVEPQRTNLALYSSQFDDAVWQKRNNIAITTNATTSPDGTLTADKMYLSNNLIADYGCFQIITSASRTFSVYAKKAELQYLFLGFNNDNASEGVFFNLNTGAISQNTGAYTATISDAGNGWYRCTAYFPTISYCFISPSINGTSFLVTGQLNNGIYIWGAQVESGSYPTSYIPTTSASVTRNADVVSKTGISSLIGQTEGTLFAEIEVSKLIGIASRYIFHISDGTTNNRIYFAFSGSSSNVLRGRIFNGGTLQCSIDTSTITSTGTYKLALAYKNNDIVFYVNGVQVGVDTSATIPTCSRVDLGQNYANTSQLSDGIKASTLWKTRLTNTQLAQLTTI